jgi:hypothetical protein
MDPYTYRGSKYVNGKYERIMDALSEQAKNNFYEAKNLIKKKPTTRTALNTCKPCEPMSK